MSKSTFLKKYTNDAKELASYVFSTDPMQWPAIRTVCTSLEEKIKLFSEISELIDRKDLNKIKRYYLDLLLKIQKKDKVKNFGDWIEHLITKLKNIN